MAIFCFAAVPTAAFGSTVGKSGTTLTYTASPTENNSLTITDDGSFYVFDEVGGVTVSVAAGSGCISFGANTAKCPKAGVSGFNLDMKEGTNSATLSVPLPATFVGTTGNDVFTGSSGADTFTLGAGTNEANGAGGNDTFNSGSGVDELNGSSGDDLFKQGTAADGADALNGGTGTDTAEYVQRTANLVIVQDENPGDGASGENDEVGDDIEIVRAGSGADSLSGGPCDSVLYGGGGNDVVNGSAAGFRSCLRGFLEGTDNDTLAGEAGNDTLNGGGHDDTLSGGAGVNVLNGGGGIDTLDATGGSDTISGGLPDNPTAPGAGDTVVYTYCSTSACGSTSVLASIDGVANDGSGNPFSGATDEGDNIGLDVENITTEGSNDILVGSADANILNSGDGFVYSDGSGHEELHGGDGVDLLQGEGGQDYLDGGATDSDTLNGGTGFDWVDYSDRNAQITATIDGVANDGGGGENDLIATDVEGLIGGRDNDNLTGNGGDNVLHGGNQGDVLNGLGGADVLNGDGIGTTAFDGGSDTLNGGDGADSLSGGSDGDDTLNGGNDADSLNGGTSQDSLHGGAGNDTLTDGDTNSDEFWGDTGTDTFVRELACDFGDPAPCPALRISLDNADNDGPSGEDNVRPDIENVTVKASTTWYSNDTIIGDADANILVGGGGADTISGGAGDDVIDARDAEAPGNATLNGEAGADTIYDGKGNDVVDAGQDNDTIVAGPGADTIGGGSHDRPAFIGFGGGDTVNYSAHGAVNVSLDGAANDGAAGEGDSVQTDVENITGGNGGDTLRGGSASNILLGGGGGDVLDGGLGADQLDGGTGTDTLDYSARTSAVTVNLAVPGGDGTAGEGDDAIAVENATGGSGNDVLTGTDSVNVLAGGGGADTLTGAAGNDTLEGGAAGDVMNGGEGVDLVDYSGRAAAITSDLDGDTDDGQAGENDRIGADVEDIAGGSGNDALTGNGAANVLTGNAGNDTFASGLGADALHGGEGNDRLGAGAVADGADQFFAGAGVDEVDYSLRAAAVTIDLTSGVSDGEAGEGDSVSSDTETLRGGLGDDVIKGGALVAHTLFGSAGADQLTGGTRDDIHFGGTGGDRFGGGGGQDRVDYSARVEPLTIDQDGVADDGAFLEGDNVLADIVLVFGGSGNDRITGSSIHNILAGGPGNDRLNGAAENDTLRGDAGDDVLEADAHKDDLVGGDGVDTADYSARTGALVITLDNLDNDGDPTLPPAGENDNVLDDVENVLGGSGNDSITGGAAANLIRGGAGSDTLRGMAGDDRLHSRDGGADTLVDCGPGTDTHAADATEAAGTGCETLQAAPFSPPVNTEAPELFGTPEIGETFTATAGTFTGVEPITYEFQWLRCDPGCVAIQGATMQTYVASAADLSKTLAVRVSASNEDGSASAQSAESDEIQPGPPPNLVFADIATAEGDDGMTTAAFEVRLSRAHMTPVTVDWATADGTAQQPADYTAANGTVTFAAGDTSETVAVQVLSDLVDESDESFVVDFTNASNAALPDTQAVGTIQDDDAAPGATTAAATDIGETAATLNGTVVANGRDTTYWFEYGLTTSYGTETTHTELAPDADLAVSALVASLTAGTPYHFRLVATSPSGTTRGADQIFTTASPPAPPPPAEPAPAPPPAVTPPAPPPHLAPPAPQPNGQPQPRPRPKVARKYTICHNGRTKKVTKAQLAALRKRIAKSKKRPKPKLTMGACKKPKKKR